MLPLLLLLPAVSEYRLPDANCTCVFDTAWSISSPGGCARPCSALPDYALVVAAAGTPKLQSENGDLGFPPWRCGGTNTGAFFLTCADALRVEQWVYCHEDCRCQAEFQRIYDSQCPSTPHHNTNCGTTCACWGSVNLNLFASDCDCDTVSAACEKIPICDDVNTCTQEDAKMYAKEWLDMGCAAMNENNVGVSPGRAHYPPESCAWDLGCDLSTTNNGQPNQCPPPPPRVPTGTTGSGTYGDPSGGIVSTPRPTGGEPVGSITVNH